MTAVFIKAWDVALPPAWGQKSITDERGRTSERVKGVSDLIQPLAS